MANTLAQAKESIWTEISKEMTEVWPSIQIIFEQEELINKCKIVIEQEKATLKHKPIEELDMIKVLNSKSRVELE